MKSSNRQETVNLAAYSFEAVLMVSLLVAYQGNSIKRRKE
jgi:hypothetical protein